MTVPKNNQELYEQIDELCVRLRAAGMDAQADRIGYLIHHVAWTSTSELFENLDGALDAALSGPNAINLSPELAAELRGYLNLLRR